MATQYVDDCTWRIVDHEATTDPETAFTTLTARWRGRKDQSLTQFDALIPGGACPVTGFTNLRLSGLPRLDARVGPFEELIAVYTGFKDGDFSFETSRPLSVFTHEAKNVRLQDSLGRSYDCMYEGPHVVTVWRSDTLQANPRYENRINAKGDPLIVSATPVDAEKHPPTATFTKNTHYAVTVNSGWSEQGQDPGGFWNNVEFAEKLIVPIN